MAGGVKHAGGHIPFEQSARRALRLEMSKADHLQTW
jgi:hypothetical protein